MSVRANVEDLAIEREVVSVPVAGIVPPELTGAGIGGSSEQSDYDNSFGHGYRKRAWTTASVAHADSIMTGHAPGVNMLLASRTGQIHPHLASRGANIADLLGLRPPP